MNIELKTPDNSRFVLSQALLIYKKYDQHVSTIHNVIKNVIQPGEPLNQQALKDTLHKLTGENNQPTMRFLPENLLAVGYNAMAWFAPSRVSNIYFKTGNKALDRLSGAKVRYPAIVFKVANERMTAFAVYGNSKPSLSDRLFIMPFFNCSGTDGWVCLPSASKPNPEPGSVSQWENLFYESNFSHSAMGGGVIVKGGHTKFWMRYVDQCRRKIPKRFPCEHLIAKNITLGDFINE